MAYISAQQHTHIGKFRFIFIVFNITRIDSNETNNNSSSGVCVCVRVLHKLLALVLLRSMFCTHRKSATTFGRAELLLCSLSVSLLLSSSIFAFLSPYAYLTCLLEMRAEANVVIAKSIIPWCRRNQHPSNQKTMRRYDPSPVSAFRFEIVH